MSQVHRPNRETGPGLGRVLVSTVVSLGALVALGVAIYAWNTPESPTRPESGNRSTSLAVSGIGEVSAPTRPYGAPAPSDGLVGTTANEASSSPTPSPAASPAALSSLAASDPEMSRESAAVRIGLDSESQDATDRFESGDLSGVSGRTAVEDLTDIERPVSYSDAEAYFHSGEFGEASRYFSAYVEDRGENPWGFYMLGLSRLRAGRPDAAEAAFLGALDLDPDHTKSLVNLARARMELARHEDALIPAERAVHASPGNSSAHRVHARVLHNLGRPDDAAGAYVSALEIDGEDAWSMNNLGLIRIEQEEFTAAVPPLALATELDSSITVFQNNLGIALERIGDYSGAVAAYDRAIVLDESNERALGNRARAGLLVPSQSREPLDLAIFAAAFAREISGDQAAVETQVVAPTEPMTADADQK